MITNAESGASHKIEVTNIDGVRTLYVDGKPQSAMNLADPTSHVFTYTRYFHLPLIMGTIKRVLFIGGGGFSGPKIFAHKGIAVDVVEIDPTIVDIAQTQFDLDMQRINTYIMDGREFLESQSPGTKDFAKYDLIIMDAFEAHRIPPHLATKEFYELAADHLTDDGMLLTNIISATSGHPSKYFFATAKTLGAVFAQVYAFDTHAESPQTRNIILIATKNPERSTRERLHELNAQKNAIAGFDLSVEIAALLDEIDPQFGEVLSDANLDEQ